ncbi:class I SAM-dependent methyltransferase [Phycicoccus sp. CSK15P-2]|uniref:class I SAM-dependent methyltransferase n=1 Tax=Phycicoccus sp. CSK15P-2 TaxID=2807627 RepID=UPI00194ED40F|nr:class I SAM-dependent methyltransferase [Phycicoccus sp. CSK15P-2]MBM6404404.1 class I SAM-dependent methyltransferase [Phycicoccus sp. CSK15P-2]
MTSMSDQHVWDERYSEQEGIWSGEPNHALTVEAAGLAPGRALDVGCGEGADAVWLTRRGWEVTGIDPSVVALGRARLHAESAGVRVTWRHGTLAGLDLPAGGFDLVSAFYAVLEKDTQPLGRLTSLVAPGGTLLVVHHDTSAYGQDHGHGHGTEAQPGPRFDPDLLLLPADVATGLGDGWTVSGPELRHRVITGGAGGHHVDDVVVRATRVG